MNSPDKNAILAHYTSMLRTATNLPTPFELDEDYDHFNEAARDEYQALLLANPSRRSELIGDAVGYMGDDVSIAIFDAVKARDGALLIQLIDAAIDKAFEAEIEIRTIILWEKSQRDALEGM